MPLSVLDWDYSQQREPCLMDACQFQWNVIQGEHEKLISSFSFIWVALISFMQVYFAGYVPHWQL